jgi:hypothetical protein
MQMKTDRQLQHGPDGTYQDITRFSPDAGKQGASQLLYFGNDGGDIESTNYFDTVWGSSGIYYLSANAGVARLLIPDSQKQAIREMQTGKVCVLTSGVCNGQVSVEIMFDDLTRSPFSLCLPQSQCDWHPRASKKPFRLTAWTRSGKVGEWTAFERVGKRLPNLQPWK